MDLTQLLGGVLMRSDMTQSIIRCLGVGLMVLGLSAPIQAAAETNPNQANAEILAQIEILNGKLDALKGKENKVPGTLGPCDVPPVWGHTYATADRFVSVLGGAAFCDKATGLVWDGSPDPTTQGKWTDAIINCTMRTVGGVKGFHLPLIEQLTSLLPLLPTDLNSATGDGPFSNVGSNFYLSATTVAVNPASAWNVSFSIGIPGSSDKVSDGNHAWCVLGGQAYDGKDVHAALAP